MQRDQIEETFLNLWDDVWEKTDLSYVLQQCNEQETIGMKYLYAGMPYSDMADYSAELFLKFVRHALQMRERMPWGHSIDRLTFWNYVMQYRVNNEHIEFYAETFFEDIYPRIQGLSMYEAAVEVNFWAYEKATYHSTDERTGSPFTVIKNAYGRCGEESTLVTAALRSVGIPARQVYAPRWSHCDDNHAWVEVWIDGVWHFLGACEPEEKLDRGWFVLAASRAPLIHTRVFSKFVEEEDILPVCGEERETRINVLSHYADTKKVCVTVLDCNGNPKPDVTVQFEVINYSELYPLVSLKTNREGKTHLTTSKGSLVLSAFDETGYDSTVIDVRRQDHVVMQLKDRSDCDRQEAISFSKCRMNEESEISFTFVPAVGGEKSEMPLTKEELERQQVRTLGAEEIRHQTEASFYTEEKAQQYADNYIKNNERYILGVDAKEERRNDCREAVKFAVLNSRGNRSEIQSFLEEEATKEWSFYKCKLLDSIRKKDLSDTSSECFLDHLKETLCVPNRYDDAIFIPYVLCPRIWDERILPYRAELRQFFSKEQIQAMQKTPTKVGEWIQTHIQTKNQSSYADLYPSVVGCIRFGMASEPSKQILAVAMLRSFGIAGKIELCSGRAVYWDNGIWKLVFAERAKKKGTLCLINREKENLQYFTNITIGAYVDQHYKTLNLSEAVWIDGKCSYELEEGAYRIITTERQLGGICQVKLFFASIKANDVTELYVDRLKELAVQKKVWIDDIICERRNGTPVHLKEYFDHKEGIVAWIAIGKEPTEHLLNEIIAASERYRTVPVCLIVVSEEAFSNETLIQVRKEVPTLQVMIQKSVPDVAIYEQFQLPKNALPLVIVLDSDGYVKNACAGYNVGTGELVLNALRG